MTEVLTVNLGERLQELVGRGGLVAVGGSGLMRKPMELIRTLSASRIEELRVISFLGSVDVEYLLAKSPVRELHTAGVSLEGVGLAPLYRQARQSGSVDVVEWSEGSLAASLEAAARGFPSMVCPTSPRSGIVDTNPHLKRAPDPFSGDEVVYARALQPDVALLHVSSIDSAGNLFIDGDPGIDGLLARSARMVIASAEEICERPAAEAAISRIWVDIATVIPRGSWPTATAPATLTDLAAVQGWAAARGGDLSLLEVT
jgi:glutaconate CoA-transferase subunit A